MDNGKKNTLKVLTTNDIRNHARDWTLAGDVGLLAHLERFSESIINKTQETQTNFNELVDVYEELYTKVGNITNQFLALQNCQFVENRVYDEETPTEEKTEVKVQDAADQEKLLLMQYKEAVEVGIKLLDTHFHEVQLPPNSDSDEEDEVTPGNSIVWKPKNPYAGKKFPFLIGSAEWWADDDVGLRPNKECLNAEKIISESESDAESLKSIEKTMKSSYSSSMENIKSTPAKPTFMESSEDLFGFNKSEIVKNMSDDLSKGSDSLPEGSTDFFPGFGKEPEIEARKRADSADEYQKRKEVDEKSSRDEIAVNKPKKVDDEFTRELMAKLGTVTAKSETGLVRKEAEVEKEAAPPTKPRDDDGLFDETDNTDDLFSAKITKVADVEKDDLFFVAENDDDLFRGENDLFSGSSLFQSHVFKKEGSRPVGKNDLGALASEPNVPEKAAPIAVAPKKNLANDLFDNLDDDDDEDGDDTLFASKPADRKPSQRSLATAENDRFKESKPSGASGLSWDNDEGLFDGMNAEFDNGIFDSSGLFDASTNKREEPNLTVSKSKEIKTDFPSEPEIATKPEDKKDIIDTGVAKPARDSDDPFGLSSSKDSGYKKISTLDSEEEDDLFSKSFLEERIPPVKVTALLDEEDDDVALFGDKPKPPDSVSVSSSRSSLFDDASASKSRLASVFDKDKTTKSEENLCSAVGDGKPGRDLFSTKGREERSSLFDDCDDGDDLFGAGTNATGKSIFRKSTEESIARKDKNDASSSADDLEENDLFKASGAATKLRSTKSDIFRRSEQKLFSDDSCDGDLFSEKPPAAKPKPPSSLSLKSTEAKGQTVGKLNIPDSLKVRFESAAKNISPGAGKPPEKKAEKAKEGEEEEEVLDEPIQVSALLKCPSKDRVKIPGRRRPQSRRARHAAIRDSGGWDQPLSSATASRRPVKEGAPSPAASNPLSPSTDEEDFFKVPELDTNFEKEDQSIFKSDLFDSSKTSKLDDNLLFDGAPVLSPLSPRKTDEAAEKKPATKTPESLFGPAKPKVPSIFDDDDYDCDLDGEDDESLFKTSKRGSEMPKKTEEKSKKPLFDPDVEDDDDDDDDDLFGGKSHVTSCNLQAVDKRKEGGEAKEKGNSSFVDPLGLITKNE